MNKSEYRNMWVYIEHDGKTVHPVSLELCCEARRLCDITGEKLAAVIIGSIPADELEKVYACGVDQLIRVSGTGYGYYNDDAYTNALTVLSEKYRPSAIFIGATVNGRDFAPRTAIRLNTGCTSDAMQLEYDRKTGDIRFIEPAVGGKIMAVITFPVMRPQIGTIRPGIFKYAPTGARENVSITEEVIDFPEEKIRTRILDYVADEIDPALKLDDADVIVCVGNGLANESDLDRYRELAALLGGKLGCTRPLFDRGILPYALQIGQSGVMVKPKLYIGFGISGAVNHVAGVGADMFIAVNKKADAQIFNYCDYGIVGDMNEVCDAMIYEIKQRRAGS